jgi:hypothetical protein
MGFGLVGLVLGFELSSQDGDILGGFVSGLLEVILAVMVKGGEVLGSFVPGFLKVTVTVVSDISKVNVKVLEDCVAALIVEHGGLVFGKFGGLPFGPGL